jgi:hypothetical protein
MSFFGSVTRTLLTIIQWLGSIFVKKNSVNDHLDVSYRVITPADCMGKPNRRPAASDVVDSSRRCFMISSDDIDDEAERSSRCSLDGDMPGDLM